MAIVENGECLPKVPYLIDCLIEARISVEGDQPEMLFYRSAEHLDCFLKGYAIVPREKYAALQEIARRLKAPE